MPMRGCPRPSTGIGRAAPTGTALVGATAAAPAAAPSGSAAAAMAASRPERGSLTVSGIPALLSENPSDCDCPFTWGLCHGHELRRVPFGGLFAVVRCQARVYTQHWAFCTSRQCVPVLPSAAAVTPERPAQADRRGRPRGGLRPHGLAAL